MKYTVHLNAYACISYEVEADSPTEAYEKACEEASLSDVSVVDWCHENPGEISDEKGNYISIEDLEE